MLYKDDYGYEDGDDDFGGGGGVGDDDVGDVGGVVVSGSSCGCGVDKNLEDFFAEEHFPVNKDASQLSELDDKIFWSSW